MKKVLFALVLIMSVMIVNAQPRVNVKVADLPKAITDNVAKDYAGFTIKGATQVTVNNVVSYEVAIVKGATTETLAYDKDGKFVKKITQKAGTAANKPASPAAKPATKPATKPTTTKK